MLGSWSATNGAVQMLGSLQLDFFLPQGEMSRRDQLVCMNGDSRTGEERAATAHGVRGSKACGSWRGKVWGVGMLGWERMSPRHMELPGTSHTWLGFNFLYELLFAAIMVLWLLVLQTGGELLSCCLL